MASDKAWKNLVTQQLTSHDKKLDKLLESVSGMKVKIALGAAMVSGIVAFIVSRV